MKKIKPRQRLKNFFYLLRCYTNNNVPAVVKPVLMQKDMLAFNIAVLEGMYKIAFHKKPAHDFIRARFIEGQKICFRHPALAEHPYLTAFVVAVLDPLPHNFKGRDVCFNCRGERTLRYTFKDKKRISVFPIEELVLVVMNVSNKLAEHSWGEKQVGSDYIFPANLKMAEILAGIDMPEIKVPTIKPSQTAVQEGVFYRKANRQASPAKPAIVPPPVQGSLDSVKAKARIEFACSKREDVPLVSVLIPTVPVCRPLVEGATTQDNEQTASYDASVVQNVPHRTTKTPNNSFQRTIFEFL